MIRVLSVLLLLVLAAPVASAAEERAAAPTGPLTVDDAVRIALQNNYAYLQSEARVDAAAGSRMQAWSGILPVLSASGSFTRDDNHSEGSQFNLEDSSVSTNTLDSVSDTWGGSVSLSERLGLSGIYNVTSARRAEESARFSSDAWAQETAFQVRQQYFLVIRAQDLLQVQDEDLRLANDELRRTRSMYELGSVAKVDVLKAEVRVSDAEVALIRQENQVETERFALAKLLGFGPLTRLELDANLDMPILAEVDSAQAVQEALTRPDVEAARLNHAAASASATSAGLTRIPDLFVDFTYGGGSRETETRGEQFFGSVQIPANVDSDGDQNGWTLRAGLTVTLDAFLNSGAAKQAGGRKREAEYALEDQRLLAVQELATSVLTYRAAIKALEASQRGVTASEEDYRLSQERYAQGLGTILDLLTAQVALTRARSQYVDSQTALRIAEAGVQRARGAELPS